MSAESWRDQEGLFRNDDEDTAPLALSDRRWQQVFGLLEAMGAQADFMQRRMLQGAAVMLRGAAAKDPDQLRDQLIGIMRGLAAALEVEPAEMYPATPEEAHAE